MIKRSIHQGDHYIAYFINGWVAVCTFQPRYEPVMVFLNPEDGSVIDRLHNLMAFFASPNHNPNGLLKHLRGIKPFTGKHPLLEFMRWSVFLDLDMRKANPEWKGPNP